MASKSVTTKLPTLLASLSPSTSTKPILLRPLSWPSSTESFYLLTRHSLKFPLRTNPTSRSKPPSSTSKLAAKNWVTPPKDGEGDEIKVAGKAWGIKFWNGRPVILSSPRIPDPLIPHSLTEEWTSVDITTLSSNTQQLIKQSNSLIAERYKERNSVLSTLKEGKRDRSTSGAEKSQA